MEETFRMTSAIRTSLFLFICMIYKNAGENPSIIRGTVIAEKDKISAKTKSRLQLKNARSGISE